MMWPKLTLSTDMFSTVLTGNAICLPLMATYNKSLNRRGGQRLFHRFWFGAGGMPGIDGARKKQVMYKRTKWQRASIEKNLSDHR